MKAEYDFSNAIRGAVISKTKLKPECKHTPCPDGYVWWHEWAKKKSKTHKQVKCEHCGLYKVWVKK